jgi:sarcosine oxidase subunit gamma
VTASTDRAGFRRVALALQVNLRGDPGDPAFVAAVAGVLGVALPVMANTWAQCRQCMALWLGPDEWLLVAPDGDPASLEAALHAALRGQHHAVVDVSASRHVLELSGAQARGILAKGCSLDLHVQAFAPPQCAQTLLAKAQVILQCVDASPCFRLYVRLSCADYLETWLADATAETAAALRAGLPDAPELLNVPAPQR